MTFICICYESILFEPGKDIVLKIQQLQHNSFCKRKEWYHNRSPNRYKYKTNPTRK